jgi:hypothetical protein
LDFAKKLTKEGVLSLDQPKVLPEIDPREILEDCRLKKLQVRTVLKSIYTASSAPSPASAAEPPHKTLPLPVFASLCPAPDRSCAQLSCFLC